MMGGKVVLSNDNITRRIPVEMEGLVTDARLKKVAAIAAKATDLRKKYLPRDMELFTESISVEYILGMSAFTVLRRRVLEKCAQNCDEMRAGTAVVLSTEEVLSIDSEARLLEVG